MFDGKNPEEMLLKRMACFCHYFHHVRFKFVVGLMKEKRKVGRCFPQGRQHNQVILHYFHFTFSILSTQHFLPSSAWAVVIRVFFGGDGDSQRQM